MPMASASEAIRPRILIVPGVQRVHSSTGRCVIDVSSRETSQALDLTDYSPECLAWRMSVGKSARAETVRLPADRRNSQEDTYVGAALRDRRDNQTAPPNRSTIAQQIAAGSHKLAKDTMWACIGSAGS